MEDIKKIIASIPTFNERQAFSAGYDSVKNGANTKNCHFSYFATKALSDAWSQGAQRAKAECGKGPQR